MPQATPMSFGKGQKVALKIEKVEIFLGNFSWLEKYVKMRKESKSRIFREAQITLNDVPLYFWSERKKKSWKNWAIM